MVAAEFARSLSPVTTIEDRLVVAPPHPACDTIVIIPARNEEESIARALEALRRQVDTVGRPVNPHRFEVIILANNCTDRTAEIARFAARRFPSPMVHVVERTLPPTQAHVGRARQLLMDEACRRLLRLGRCSGIIASTDADTIVADDWLTQTWAAFRNGPSAVAGRIILPEDANGGESRRYYLLDAAYRHLLAELESLIDPDEHDPWPRHHQHFGASLAVTAGAYQRAGGLPAPDALEDMAFVDRLERSDLPIRHTPLVRAWTSGRRDGRVAMGLSTQLAEWDGLAKSGEKMTVESPRVSERRLRARRRARELHTQHHRGHQPSARAVESCARHLGVEPSWLKSAFRSGVTIGMLLQAVDREIWASEPRAPQRVPITQAVHELRLRRTELRAAMTLPTSEHAI